MSAQPGGNSRAYLLGRLKLAGRSDLLAAVVDGRMTAFEAATEAGLRKLPQPRATDTALAKRKAFRRHPGQASKDMEMWLGVGHDGSVFATEAEAECYWREHRARLWPLLCVNGRRPRAWWHWEAKLICDYDDETALLYDLGELSETEERHFVPIWRRAYDRIAGLQGYTATRAGLDEAILPRNLLRQWNGERRRARRQIRQLQATAGASGELLRP
jgi:hypothetical protein